MDKNLLAKTIFSCLIGAVLWCGVDFVICTIKKVSFIDTFFTPKNLIELVAVMAVAGFAYYGTQKNKNK